METGTGRGFDVVHVDIVCHNIVISAPPAIRKPTSSLLQMGPATEIGFLVQISPNEYTVIVPLGEGGEVVCGKGTGGCL